MGPNTLHQTIILHELQTHIILDFERKYLKKQPMVYKYLTIRILFAWSKTDNLKTNICIVNPVALLNH